MTLSASSSSAVLHGSRQRALLALFLTVALAACSGSDDSPPPAPAAPAPVAPPPDPLAPVGALSLTALQASFPIEAAGVGGDAAGDGGAAGAAGDGSPLGNVVVTLTDATGKQVSGKTDSRGRFLLRYQTSQFQPPLVLRAVDAAGNVLASASQESATAASVIRVNVNPLTDKIVSDAIAGQAAGTDKNFTGLAVNALLLAQAKANLVKSIDAALRTAGVAETAKFDPVKSNYEYNGTGVDAVIDSIAHARDAQTGATQLRAKLAGVQTDANGVAQPTLITAEAPLAPALVSVPTSPALTFGKLSAWVDEVNRCLALTSAQQLADADCRDADGSRLVATEFKHNARDFTEHLRTLFSESDGTAVQGSRFRNPTLLFTARTSNAATVDDIAVVEFTVQQPRTGPLSSNVNEPVEYTTIIPFRRHDGLTRAKAGNWVAFGNQRNYEMSLRGRYIRSLQNNPLRNVNAPGNSPDMVESTLSFNIVTTRYDIAQRRYVSANLRAVRVKGPGLPAAGLVFAPSTTVGSEGYLPIHNKLGQVDAGPMTTTLTGPHFRLNTVLLDGSPIYPTYFPATPGTPGQSFGHAVTDTPLTDFSALQAYSQYRFEIFLNSNPGNATPDSVDTVTLLAPVSHPNLVRTVSLNDFSPSLPLVTPVAAGGCSFELKWINNPNAAPVNGGFVFGTERVPKNATSGAFTQTSRLINASANASLVNRRLSSAIASTTNCPAGAVPELTGVAGGGDQRQVGITSSQGRNTFVIYMNWNN